jgi:hypothetical protein
MIKKKNLNLDLILKINQITKKHIKFDNEKKNKTISSIVKKQSVKKPYIHGNIYLKKNIKDD